MRGRGRAIGQSGVTIGGEGYGEWMRGVDSGYFGDADPDRVNRVRRDRAESMVVMRWRRPGGAQDVQALGRRGR